MSASIERMSQRRRVVMRIAAKDLRIEIRSRIIANQVLPFAGLVLVLFAFALDVESVMNRVAPGLVWLAAVFSLFFLVQRSYALETADGALDALRVSGVDLGAVFLGKALALMVQLFVLVLLLAAGAVLLYRAEIRSEGVVLLVTTVILATAGMSAVGTLYGGLSAGAKGRETLLPLLLTPVVAPVLIAAARATEAALGTAGTATGDGWPWVGLLGTFAVVFGVVGTVAFGPLIEE
jgi:heme exporter protein B